MHELIVFNSFWDIVGKNLKESLIVLEENLVQLTDKLQLEAQSIPNTTHPDVPVGDEENSVIRKEVVDFCITSQIMPYMYLQCFLIRFGYVIQVGSQRNFSFPIKDHIQLGKDLDLFDFDAASEV
jgi:seryl-tRNA synthetase